MTKSMICDQCRYLAHEYYADTPPQKACRSCPQAGSCPRARAGSASGRSCGCGSRQGMGGAQSSRNQGAQMRRCAANDASHTSCDCGQSSCNVNIVDKQSLMMQITQCEFICIDINLYLDTHPCDERALADYNCYAQQLEALKALYVKHYGPLQNFGNSVGGENWNWIDKPWPWCPRKQLEGR